MASSAIPLTFDVARMLHPAQLPLPRPRWLPNGGSTSVRAPTAARISASIRSCAAQAAVRPPPAE